MKGGLGVERRRGRCKRLEESRCVGGWEEGIEARGKDDLEAVGVRIGEQ